MAGKKDQRQAAKAKRGDAAAKAATQSAYANSPNTWIVSLSSLALCLAWMVRTMLLQDKADFAVMAIDRVSKPEMSKDRFLSEYSAQKPVVITGAWSEDGWRPAEVVASCQDAQIRTFRYDESSMTWARHVQVGVSPLPEYYGQHFVPDVGKRPKPIIYGFEMELTKHCPKQLENLKIPSFLSEDVFHIVTNRTGLGWPSVLFGPEGSVTGLHIDTHQLPFWIAVVAPAGESSKPLKRFRVFPHTDMQLLKYGETNSKANMVFRFDPWKPDFKKYPDIARSAVYEAELRSGDLLYIPGGSPHAVLNLGDNIGISMNFLDLKTFPNFARRCNNKSPLCGLVAGKGSYILDRLDQQRAKPNDQNYFQFAGIADRQNFCQVHAQSVAQGDLPALIDYCQV